MGYAFIEAVQDQNQPATPIEFHEHIEVIARYSVLCAEQLPEQTLQCLLAGNL